MSAMYDLSSYLISADDRCKLEQLLFPYRDNLSLESLWLLMDRVWIDLGCDNIHPDPQCLSSYYSHPIWLLNGIFIEHDPTSMSHRESIASMIASLKPSSIVDFGGGFGTLARLIAERLPCSQISICEPFPPAHGVESCKMFSNIDFVSDLVLDHYDALVCTDVLEHVLSPVETLVLMISAVRLGGHLIIANCFYPVISCHLPRTFHLRYSFNLFCKELGLDYLGPCEGSHAHVYIKTRRIQPDWHLLRSMQRQSRLYYALRELKAQYVSPCKSLLLSTLRLPTALFRSLQGKI